MPLLPACPSADDAPVGVSVPGKDIFEALQLLGGENPSRSPVAWWPGTFFARLIWST